MPRATRSRPPAEARQRGVRPRRRRREIDDADRAILAALQQDGRRSIRAISSVTGLRPSTAHQRLNRLIGQGVIRRFTVDVDEEAVGRGMVVFMLVGGKLDSYLGDDFLAQGPLVEAFGITGEFDLLLKLRFSGLADFNRFLITFRERYSGSVHKTVTMVATATLKDQRPSVVVDDPGAGA